MNLIYICSMKTDVLKYSENYSYCYLRPVVAILHYLHGNKQSLLFHPKILSPIKRTGNKNAACRYLVRVCFSLYIL